MTYSGDPENSDSDKVRFLIGDTDNDDLLLSDTEISSLLQNRSPKQAAIAAAKRIAAQFSRLASQRLGDYAEEAQQKADNYRQLVEELREEVGGQSGQEATAAIFESEKDELKDTDDWVEPRFSTGQFDSDRV